MTLVLVPVGGQAGGESSEDRLATRDRGGRRRAGGWGAPTSEDSAWAHGPRRSSRSRTSSSMKCVRDTNR